MLRVSSDSVYWCMYVCVLYFIVSYTYIINIIYYNYTINPIYTTELTILPPLTPNPTLTVMVFCAAISVVGAAVTQYGIRPTPLSSNNRQRGPLDFSDNEGSDESEDTDSIVQ